MKIETLIENLPDNYNFMDSELLLKAYHFAEKAHEGQFRVSEEPYITHCVAVARILAEMKVPPAVVIAGLLQIPQEVAMLKSKWWRIESKFFKRTGNVKIVFESHERYTIIDIFSPDRLGFLYHVTSKMNELGLIIYFAKIATKGDDIVDAFYVLDRNGHKVSPNDYELIKTQLIETINQIL